MSTMDSTSGWTKEYEALPVLQKLKAISHIKGFEKVQFIIFYGSATCGDATPDSDLDISIYFESTNDKASRFRFEALSQIGDDRFDIQIFQQLPLYVRIQVLKGVVLFCRDLPFVYETAVLTIKEFDSFKHRLYDYTGQASIS
jgi:uncharacterized protein